MVLYFTVRSKHTETHIYTQTNQKISTVGWCTSTLLAVGQMRQEDYQFELSMGYVVNHKPVSAML